MSSTLLVSAILALNASACPDPVAAPSLMTLPAELTLVDLVPGSTVKPSVWLVNRGSLPVSVLSARGTCGCTTIDFKPVTLDPWAAIEVPLVIRAQSQEGASKSVDVNFAIEGAAPLKLPVRVATRGDAPDLRLDVVADPPRLDLGSVVAGSTMTTSARLVNNGDLPRTVKAAHSSCACTRVVDFKEVVLEPDEAVDVQLEVDVPAAAGPATRELTILVEGEKPLRVPLDLRSTHPAMEAAERELAHTLTAGFKCDGFALRGDTITAVAWDKDRTLPQGLVTCVLAEDGRIASVRFDPLHAATRTAS